MWNFADMFLLKEKVACTFEHLQLEREVLLQYEELGAFVFAEPDLSIAKTTTTTTTIAMLLGLQWTTRLNLCNNWSKSG